MKKLIVFSFLGLLLPTWARAEDALVTAASTATPVTVEVSTPAAPAPEPFLWLVNPAKSKIVSVFGTRPAPVKPGATKGEPEVHEGIDFRVTPGAPVYAAKAGSVLFAGFSKVYVSRKDKKEQHRFIILKHEDGTSSRYVHLASLKVTPRTAVIAGQVIGTTADSDERNEPVLHFEVRDALGKPVNPAKLLAKKEAVPAPAEDLR